MGKEIRTIIPENLVKSLQQAIVESERDNTDSHGAEVRFAQRVARYPEIIKLRYLRIRRIIRLTGAPKGIVLDIGAGKCLNAALALIAGAREVHAVDMDEQRFQSARFLLEHLDKSTSFGFRERVHLINADVLQLNLSSEQFSAVWSMELLEHIADSVQLHRMVYRWLKPGGSVYHRTGANGANPIKERFSFSDYWDRVDTIVLAPIRRQIILSLTGTSVKASELDALVKGTRGLTEAEIAQVVGLWQESGLKSSIAGLAKRVPRHPVTGEYFERPLSPQQVLKELRAAGFVPQLVKPDFGCMFIERPLRRHIYRLAGQMIRVAHPLSLFVAPWIEILGTKPA